MSRRTAEEPETEEISLERVTRRRTGGPNRDRPAELAAMMAIAIGQMEERRAIHADRITVEVARLAMDRVKHLESAGGGTERALGRAEAELEQARRRIAELEELVKDRRPAGEALGDLLKLGGHVAGLLAGERIQQDARAVVRSIHAAHGVDGVTAYLEAVATEAQQIISTEVSNG